MQNISFCLWFESEAEEAANFYVSLFDNAKILSVSRYPESVSKASGIPEGTVMTVFFELAGTRFMALNGGGPAKFNESASIMANCDSQDEIDRLWNKLTADGGKEVQCGWLTDRFGVSWQIVPTVIGELLDGSDPERVNRVMQAVMQMTKLDIATMRRAYDGE